MYRSVALVVLVALASCVLGEPGKEKSQAWTKCMEESGIAKGTFKDTPWDDPKKKCFQACMMREHGHLKEDGTVDSEKMIADIPPDFEDRDRISAAITECSANQNDDQCETAHLVMKCLHDKDALVFPGGKKIHAAMKKCMEENGVEHKDFRELSPDDQKMKCFGACMMKEQGHIKDDGTIDTEKAIADLPPHIPDRDRVIAAMNECGTQKGDDDCETAGLVWKCLEEKNALPPMGPHHHHHHHHPH